MVSLQDLGYDERIVKTIQDENLSGFEVGRVIIEHKERYIVKTRNGEFEAEIIGNMRFTAKSREDFPAVGDWVLLNIFDNSMAIIHKILPRFSVIKRQAVGQNYESQIIASNIDYAFIIQAADRDFNINRLERYLTICYSSNVEPIIVISKSDLIDSKDLEELVEQIKVRTAEVKIIAISNETKQGYDSIKSIMQRGKTYCMLGSSGVGKSTLLNNLSGKELMKTGEISKSTSKGKHVTSHRELTVLESGGILIDNPGMREVGLADSSSGLEKTFDLIHSLSKDCKFKDCTHTTETGCRVLLALENDEIDEHSYYNYLKLEKEKAHFERNLAEKKKKEKSLAKIVKNYKKDMKKNNY